MIPSGGLREPGRSSKGIQPVQSWAPEAPSTGRSPRSPFGRTGMRPGIWYPMLPATSAYTKFWDGAPYVLRAARNSSNEVAVSRRKKDSRTPSQNFVYADVAGNIGYQ